MNVVFIPDARYTNIYQKNLSYSLSKQGVNVYFGNNVIWAILKYRPDILHIHWPYPFLIANNKIMTVAKSTRFICGLLALKLFGIKIIWTVHNMADHEGKFKSLESSFNKYLAALCNKLIAHCPSAKTEIEKIYNIDSSSIAIVPHGNYVGQYENNMTNLEARDKLKLDKEDMIFLYFGQIRSYKGIPELISAFKKLNCQKIKLLIVGKPLNEEIALNILNSCKEDDRIINILKFVPDRDIQIYMNAADVIVLPYKNVLTSGAAILAMSFSKPIIAPAVMCIADTLDERGSFLYTGDNLLNAMRHVLEVDKENLINMGKHNFELTEQFPWDDVAKRTYDVYKECVNR